MITALTGWNYRCRTRQPVVSIALQVATCNPKVVPAALCKVTDVTLQMLHIIYLTLACQHNEVLITAPLHCQTENTAQSSQYITLHNMVIVSLFNCYLYASPPLHPVGCPNHI